jgi:hypothetical protein
MAKKQKREKAKASPQEAESQESKVVQATGASATVRGNKDASRILEEAMSSAAFRAISVEKLQRDDPLIKVRMMEAYEKAKKDLGL